MDKLAYKSLVTPKEAVRLSEYRSIQDIYIAVEIAKEYKATGIVQDLTWVFGTIWNAGRMQGIREERAKRANIERNGRQ